MTSNICGTMALTTLRGKIRGHYGIMGDVWQDVW
jgi:hypothetical protein